ncbi:hypothetical protein GQ457_04G006200 [Hibiscus cannabinus]
MHEAEETEVDTVEGTKADVVVDHMVATKQVKTTRHQVEDEVLEVEVEAGFNKEINFRSTPKNEEIIHVAAAEEEKNEEYYAFLSYKGNEESKKYIWYLDNCASNHMCGRKEWFVELDEKVRGRVIFGDDSHAEVKGKGKVMITQKNGEKKYITDVYYVPAMKSNIISLGQLLEKGYEVQMKNQSLSLKNKNGELVVQVDMTQNRLFTIDIESGEVKCMKTAIKDDSWLWHLRYGHLGFSGLKLLSKAKMVNGLPEINSPNQLCEACIKGKQHRQSFEVGKSWRARRPLEIVHTDIAGPFDIPSVGGNMYYLTFIDDYSRKCWVYVLKEKSEALAKFKEFKAMAEKQSGSTDTELTRWVDSVELTQWFDSVRVNSVQTGSTLGQYSSGRFGSMWAGSMASGFGLEVWVGSVGPSYWARLLGPDSNRAGLGLETDRSWPGRPVVANGGRSTVWAAREGHARPLGAGKHSKRR